MRKIKLIALLLLLAMLSLVIASCGAGVGVVNAIIDEEGNLIITLSDGSVHNLGKVADLQDKTHQHTPSEWIIDVEATCTEDGAAHRVCTDSICGKMLDQETIPALGHEESDWEDVVVLSCEEDGCRQKRCLTCGEVLESEIVASIGHMFSVQEIPPTTEEPGYTLHTCIQCGYSYTDNYIAAFPFAFE